jgi:hypothetical protein
MAKNASIIKIINYISLSSVCVCACVFAVWMHFGSFISEHNKKCEFLVARSFFYDFDKDNDQSSGQQQYKVLNYSCIYVIVNE